MNKTQKINLLYQKAKGQSLNITSEEKNELRKYKIDAGSDALHVTKANIGAYVNAVDNDGCRLSFYDWCMNNNKADRRRKGGSKEELASFNRSQSAGVIFVGWLTWGLAIYWMFHGALSVGKCAVAGAIVALVIFKCARKWAGFTLILLPIILTVIFAS